MSSPLIDARALSRRYGAVLALDRFTVSIAPGITGLVGANGAGKSTFIRILLGLVTPSAGEVSVLGHDVRSARANIRALVGYMPEHDCLPPDMSAAEFTTFMGRLSGLPAHAARERSAEVLRHVGLFEERYRPIGSYSTGMAQRVKLAQALVHDPRVLILDEPTNGLDPAGREEMLALIRRTGREFGISVLLSSHLLGELERICDGIVQMDGGRLVRAESIDELTGETGDLLVDVDGDLARFAAALRTRVHTAADVVVQRHQVQVRPLAGASFDHIADAVRDAAVESDVGLLRMERARARLDDLFRDATDQPSVAS
ncbi:MAG TPA: ABC transporter ATP-binding protein [Gemmatimonas aurantiaca]|uniref:ABC transporter ATP-binding protein n=2 Tax=Gemmatimonas aurantiaca TaxID=173480 RepID=A0A3D4V3M9_9BACT|nr:ABC transporter ATP-binding protein [Gemmatimonas aurantiaca]BAH37310.1 putative ABC transporter ATP-binding protein [Gemmatimonas aurantiaca T-27]HCT55725.1 ABC transporter ATP-binding protein [Gemmatimonas aurantiaca]